MNVLITAAPSPIRDGKTTAVASKNFQQAVNDLEIYGTDTFEYKALWKISYIHLIKTGALKMVPASVTKLDIKNAAYELRQTKNHNEMVSLLIKGLNHKTSEYNNHIARESALGLASLFKGEPKMVVPQLVKVMHAQSNDKWLKDVVAQVLGEYGSEPSVIKELHKAALNDTQMAVHSLAKILGKKSMPYLEIYLKKGSYRVQEAARIAIMQLR